MRFLKRRLRLARGERGNVLVIVLGTLTVLCVFSGVAIDVGHVIAVKAQLQTAFDAGALAGAAQLAIDRSDLPAVRTTASSFAAKNFFAGGTPALTTASDNSGNVKTGVWSGGSWTPAITPPTGSVLNAVRCQWSAPVSTAFLGLIGLPTIAISGLSTAAIGAPASPCPGCAVLPIGLPGCAFTPGASEGCATLVWSDKVDGKVVWANLNGGPANNSDISTQVTQAYDGMPPDPAWGLTAGQELQTTTGDVGYGGVFDALGRFGGPCGVNQSCGQFVTKYNAASNIQVKNAAGTVVYNGKGWEVVVPILDMSASNCNPTGAQNLQIQTWTYFVVVQIINGGKCTVNNTGGGASAPWNERCDNAVMGGTGPFVNKNIVYGYYNCKHMNSPITTEPVPVAAFSSQPRLVQ
jgi:Flp pilus assembly protein TadG